MLHARWIFLYFTSCIRNSAKYLTDLASIYTSVKPTRQNLRLYLRCSQISPFSLEFRLPNSCKILTSGIDSLFDVGFYCSSIYSALTDEPQNLLVGDDDLYGANRTRLTSRPSSTTCRKRWSQDLLRGGAKFRRVQVQQKQSFTLTSAKFWQYLIK